MKAKIDPYSGLRAEKYESIFNNYTINSDFNLREECDED